MSKDTPAQIWTDEGISFDNKSIVFTKGIMPGGHINIPIELFSEIKRQAVEKEIELFKKIHHILRPRVTVSAELKANTRAYNLITERLRKVAREEKKE